MVAAALVVASSLTACSDGGGDACAAFVFGWSRDAARHIDLWTADAELRPLEALVEDGQSGGPAVSPDGRFVAFAAGRGSRFEAERGSERTAIDVVGIDGSNRRRLTPLGAAGAPSWSPDGERLVFTDGDELTVVDVESGETTPLGTGREPHWSPAGDVVAYLGDDQGLWLVDVATLERRRLRDHWGDAFVWSPDGDRIAFVVPDPDSLTAMQTIDVDSGEIEDVPASASHATRPIAWTDENRLLFLRNVRGEQVDVVASIDAREDPTRVRRLGPEEPWWMADNPACRP